MMIRDGMFKDFVEACIIQGGFVSGEIFDSDENNKNRVLLISHELSITGAPLALLHMARGLKKIGMRPVFLSPDDGSLRDEIIKEEIPLLIFPSLYSSGLLYDGAKVFKMVVANTLVTVEAVNMLNGADTPVLWWIHESEAVYTEDMLRMLPRWIFSNITIAAGGLRVSDVLKKHRPHYHIEELLFSVPDMAGTSVFKMLLPKTSGKIITFALVGTIEFRKGQDILLNVIHNLPEDIGSHCRFVFLGQNGNSELVEAILSLSERNPEHVLYVPMIERKYMASFYKQIDCLICASRDEPMSMAVTDACMFSKPIICSSNAGIAVYLEKYEAGIVYSDNDPDLLKNCICKVAGEEKEILQEMGERARRLYERQFSEEVFVDNLEKMVTQLLVRPMPDQNMVGLVNIFREQEMQLRQIQGHLTTKQAEYNERIRRLQENNEKRINTLERDFKEKLSVLEQERDEAREDLSKREQELYETQEEAVRAISDFHAIEQAFFWRITGPVRNTVITLRGLANRNSSVLLLKKGMTSLKVNGPAVTLDKIKERKKRKKDNQQWTLKPLFTEKEMEIQRRKKFDQNILFSITVPLYNTPVSFLEEMIESVRSQTYAGWQLCLADGSDEKHDYVGRICRRYARKDGRIRYRKLKKNLGISGNTNACLAMADGEYIALFDHDDLLHPAALYEMMRVICKTGADFIYTDEATFESPDINRITVIHFKPDYAPDNLRANNYICHFTAFKRSLLKKTGLFRSKYDGSQDHDLMLRLTDVAEKIVHIPEVLYYWRSHKQSVARNIGAKSYAFDAGRRVIEDYLKAHDIDARIETPLPETNIFRIRYPLKSEPLISIVIPTCDHLEDLQKCLRSILDKSTYRNFEILLIETPMPRILGNTINKTWGL